MPLKTKKKAQSAGRQVRHTGTQGILTSITLTSGTLTSGTPINAASKKTAKSRTIGSSQVKKQAEPTKQKPRTTKASPTSATKQVEAPTRKAKKKYTGPSALVRFYNNATEDTATKEINTPKETSKTTRTKK